MEEINKRFEQFIEDLKADGIRIKSASFVYTVPDRQMPFYVLKPNVLQTAVDLLHVGWMYFKKSFPPVFSAIVPCMTCGGDGYIKGNICESCQGACEMVSMTALKDMRRATRVTEPRKISKEDEP